ncbi:NifU-like protein involved in Fe-S cluster formation [Sphingomonas sp. BE138]|uniref:iron-sulfur cluster assembly scaffold protein n=1 Tax=Sphingomonas sp. BE138 TaxID=2817845 RepID=UPI002863BC6B|nr:iron-sulfur cluster assembly scaffold protein [Sphingomonas sp. BE138]MDR6789498.1 NifU-like protein involved in Fe-S cluster formation [Sphingomonas sp. BE138]
MSLDLYTPDISALAVGNPFPDRLADATGSAERRSPICGSRVTVDVRLDEDGRVAAVGTQVRACLLGQASSTLMARHVVGRSVDELEAARDALTAWLAGEGGAPDWPGLTIFTPGLKLTARHPSIRLAFEAAADAAAQARDGAPR